MSRVLNTPGMPEIMPEPQYSQPQQPAQGVGQEATRTALPETVGVMPPPRAVPRDTDSRLDGWRSLLVDFVWSLGRGMEARAANPRAGVGAAILGPFELQQMRMKQRQDEQLNALRVEQENRTRVASQEAMSRIEREQLKLPAQIHQLISHGQLNNARVPQIHAQTDATQAGIPLTQARAGLTQAQTQTEGMRPDLIQSQTEGNRANTGLTEARTETELLRPELISAQTQNTLRSANEPYRTDPLSREGIAAQIEIAKSAAANGGGRTLYERLGHEGYMKMLTDMSRARAGIDQESINSYVEGIAQGNVTNLTQIPQVVRGDTLAALGNYMIISPSDRDGIRKLSTATYLLDRLEHYSKLVTADPSDVDSALTLRGLRLSVAGVFAKGVFAEAGVLTDYDIERVNALVPGITRSIFLPGTSEKQFNELRGIIDKAKNNFSKPVGQVSGQAQPRTPAAGDNRAAPAGAPAPSPSPSTTPSGTIPDYIMQNGRLVPNPAKR